MLSLFIVALIISMIYFFIALYFLLDDDYFIKACAGILAVAYVVLFVICLGALL